MRILKPSDKNELVIFDPLSNGNVTLFYRKPTTEERVNYMRRLFKKNEKGENEIDYDVRTEYGLEILTGIGEDNFGNAEGKAISSNPESSNFDKDWKTLVEAEADELIILLAVTVFEGARIVLPESAQLPLKSAL